MLDYMRRHSRSTTIKILFWIIIAVFVLWGVGTFTGEQSFYAAEVNGDGITPREVRRTAVQLEQFYRQIYGENMTPELAKALDFKSRALDQIISQTLIRQEAERLGIIVDEDEVREAIQAIPGLTVEGRFQREVYFRYLRSQGMTPADFETQQRVLLTVKKIQELVTGALRPNEAAARELFRFTNEKVNLAYVRVKASTLAREVPVSDQDVTQYYEEQKESFREPERVAIDYVVYVEKTFEKTIEVGDADVQQEYDAFKSDRYTEPEQVHARHILVALPANADEKKRADLGAKAAAILERLKKGEDFAAVARDASDDTSNKDKGGDLGPVVRGRTEEAFETAAFALEPGALSDVVETRYGFHVIKVDEKKPSREKPLAEVREEIVAAIRADRAKNAARDAAFQDAERAGAGKSLEELAKARGVDVTSPPPFAEKESASGLAGTEVVKAAFATAAGQVGPVTPAGNELVLFRAKTRIAPHVPPLAEIRARVETALRDQKGATLAKEKAEAMRKAAAEKKQLDELAAAEKLTVEETGAFTRSGDYIPRIGAAAAFKKEVFQLTAENPVAPEVFLSGGDAFVAVLKERLPADLTEFEKKKDELVKQQLAQDRQAAMEALLNQLKRRSSVQVHPNVLESA